VNDTGQPPSAPSPTSPVEPQSTPNQPIYRSQITLRITIHFSSHSTCSLLGLFQSCLAFGVNHRGSIRGKWRWEEVTSDKEIIRDDVVGCQISREGEVERPFGGEAKGLTVGVTDEDARIMCRSISKRILIFFKSNLSPERRK
jgi:hypothetical protein